MSDKPTCSVDGCDHPVRCRGMRYRHYRLTLDGKPLDTPRQERRRVRVIEDVEWIAGTDHPDAIARRVGCRTARSMYVMLRSCDRQDLVDRCLTWWLTHATNRELAA